MSTTTVTRPSVGHSRRVLLAIGVAAAVAVGAGAAAVSLASSGGSTGSGITTAQAVTTNVDIPALWDELSTMPVRERDNVVAGLAPNVRTQLRTVAEEIGAAAAAH